MKERGRWLNELIATFIIILVGSSIQREIIRQCPELREEVRRQNQITFFVAILVCLLVLLGMYFLGGFK
jgi:hypothetical protein